MYTTYRQATKGNHQKGYKEVVIMETWKSRRDVWLNGLRERHMIHLLDHRQIKLGEKHWSFERSKPVELWDRLIGKILGEMVDPVSRTYYVKEEA